MGTSSSEIAHRVSQQCRRSEIFIISLIATWSLQNWTASIDDIRYDIYTAAGPRLGDAASHQVVYVHVPTIGTYVEYHLFSLLEYGESLRAISDAASRGDEDRNARAPMPCKVLGIMEKDGEEVQIGEVGMVLESMKMEMNVLVTAKGLFKVMLSKGEAVEEGAVLFTIT